MTNKQPAYKRGAYNPRSKPDPRKGNLKAGSINWLAKKYGLSYHHARELKKKLIKETTLLTRLLR